MSDKLLNKYQSRLTWEAWLRSFLCGLIVGGATLFIAAFVFWMTKPKFFWVSLVIFAAVVTVATLIFYFLKFRPTVKAIAKRVDALGLEERILTMNQLENDDSYIAKRQREDAEQSLKTINEKMLKITVSLALIIVTPIVSVLGMGMATVAGLSSNGILPSGSALVDEVVPQEPDEYVAVSYLVEGGGFIEGGDPEQYILKGEDTEMVMVVPEEGWVFLMWTDGLTDPARSDKKVMEDMEVTAILMELMAMPGMGMGSGEGEPGDGPPGDQPGHSDKNTNQEGMPGGASGSYEPSNQIIDGTIYYRDSDRYVEGYEEAIAILENQGVLENGEELPEEIRAILEAYFNIIS